MAAAARQRRSRSSPWRRVNLIYSIILYSIATTALLVFLFEKTQVHRVFSDGGFVISERWATGEIQPDPNRSPDNQDEQLR
jgi:hypothetical protein